MDPGKWFVAHVALPVLDLRRGTNSRACYRVAMRNLSRPLQDLRQEQWDRVRLLLDHAFRNVPHYHDAFRANGIRPEDIRRPDDFRKVPPLEKEAIQREPSRLRSADLARRRPRVRKTGGSTGQPLQYCLDRASEGWEYAIQWRGWGYGGFTVGDRRATLAGLSVVDGGAAVRRWLRTRALERNLALPAIRMDAATVDRYFRELRAFRPSFLLGYPSALALFCRMAGHALSDLGIRAVFPTAEMLYADERRAISDAFGCPVLDGYGANDGGITAFECGAHPGYHVDVERGLLEVIADGEPAAPGERGEVLATDLWNYSQPFIRYAVGDVAVPGADRSSCGRSLPLLERIEGRTTDFLILKGGLALSGPAITLIFKDFRIDDYLLRQMSGSRIDVQIVTPVGGTSPDAVLAALRRQFGSEVDVSVESVPSIERPTGGKRRFIVSSMPLALR